MEWIKGHKIAIGPWVELREENKLLDFINKNCTGLLELDDYYDSIEF